MAECEHGRHTEVCRDCIVLRAREGELEDLSEQIDELRAKLVEAKRATGDAVDAAARICDDLYETGWSGSCGDGMRLAAQRIRALKERA